MSKYSNSEGRKSYIFRDSKGALPAHLLLAEVTPTQTEYLTRLAPSPAARSQSYHCYRFYKHISRCVELTGREDSNEGNE
jgi:hypothetical protein